MTEQYLSMEIMLGIIIVVVALVAESISTVGRWQEAGLYRLMVVMAATPVAVAAVEGLPSCTPQRHTQDR